MRGIHGKVDTGAYTSSIFCSNIDFKNDVLYCKFLNSEHDSFIDKYFIFEDFKVRTVKSSNGQKEKRYCIKTTIKIGGEIHEIELTLTNRNEMKFPVLLGRKFLKGKFMVDVTKTNKLSK